MRVKRHSSQVSARNYIARLASGGHYHFTSSEARTALRVSANAAKLALNRLAKRGHIASPARGFYVIVPPAYRSLGCLPADQFIPGLMQQKKQTYYVGLLSAAQYYGATHHRPQQFQVLLEKNRRPIVCGKVRVMFVARRRISEVPIQKFNTPRGEICVSTPEATAIDLAGYPQHVGGLDNVATILADLVELIDPALLPPAAATAPATWAQRLGYMLDFLGASETTAPLRTFVRDNAGAYTPLIPDISSGNSRRDRNWKIMVNTELAPES
jgi:predicted transcriptional regulator of viral defense system